MLLMSLKRQKIVIFSIIFLSSLSFINEDVKFEFIHSSWAACTPSGNTLSCAGASGGITTNIGGNTGITNVDIDGSTNINANTPANARAIDLTIDPSDSGSPAPDVVVNIANNATLNSDTNVGGGLRIEDNGSNSLTVNNNGLSTLTQNRASHGINLFSNSDNEGDLTLNLSAGSITTTGGASITDDDDGGSDGVQIRVFGTSGDTSVNMSGTNITTSGDSSDAVDIITSQGNTGDINFDMSAGSIVTSGAQSEGLFVETVSPTSEDININLSGGDITTQGVNSNGVFINARGDSDDINFNITGGNVTTENQSSAAVQIRDNGANSGDTNFTMSGGEIETQGDVSRGLFIQSSSNNAGLKRFEINNGTIRAFGEASRAVEIIDGSRNSDGVNVNIAGGTIVTEGINARAVNLISSNSNGNVELNMTDGNVITRGAQRADAISATKATGSTGDIALNISGGEITIEGRGDAINIGNQRASGDMEVNVSGGVIMTQGVGSNGINASHSDAEGDIALNMSGGVITTNGTASHGMSVQSSNNQVSTNVNVSLEGGTIETVGRVARGINSFITSDEVTTHINVNQSEIRTAGVLAEGIHVESRAQNAGETVLNMNGGLINTQGADAQGVDFEVTEGASDGLFINLNEGAITTDSVRSSGVRTTIRTLARGGDASGDIAVNVNGAEVATSGEGAKGILATVTGEASTVGAQASGNIEINMDAGRITTQNEDAEGILAEILSAVGDIIVNVTGGDISTQDERSHAVSANVSGNTDTGATATGDISASISGGRIRTDSEDADGVSARVQNGATGDINIVMSGGEIRTANNNSQGIDAATLGDGSSSDITITMDGGTISTDADNSAGIVGDIISAAGNVVLSMNNGEIRTDGVGSNGISASSLFNDAGPVDITLNMSGGTISTSGADANGLAAGISNNPTGGDALVTMSGGSIRTSGDRAAGISAIASDTDASISIEMSGGEIRTSGINASGIRAINGQGSVDINASGGRIITTSSDGINVISNNGDANIEHGGSISATGAGTNGIFVRTRGTGAINASATGSIVAANHGLRLVGDDANAINANLNSGASITSGTGDGIRLDSDGLKTLSIASGATLDSSASGTAISDLGEGAITVNAAGDVIGDALLGNGDDTLVLSGGSFDGSIFGDLGDDTFQWTGGDLTGGISGGDGSDTFLIASGANYDGSQLLDGGDDVSSADGFTDVLTIQGQNTTTSSSNIINFERVVIDGGSIAFSDNQFVTGSDIDSNGLFLINSAQLLAGDAFALTGNLGLESGARGVFEGGGLGVYSVSGNLTNNGIVDLEDGATGDVLTVAGNYSGSGELLVDVDFANDDSDRLVIEGDVDPNAATVVTVNDVTTGDATGNLIPIIDVVGNRQASNFVLANGPIISGAFFYDFALDDRGFALASTLIPVTSPPPGGGGNSGGGNSGGGSGEGRTTTPLLQASFLPQIATFEVLAQQFLDLNKLPKYIERGSGTYANKGVESAGGWAAVSYGRNSTESSFSTTRSEHSNRGVTVQLGGDVMAFNVGQNQINLGGYLELKRGSGNVASEFGGGEFDDLDSDGFVLTATSLSDNGLYVDGQLSYKDIDAEVTPNFLLQRDANGVTRVVNNARDREFVLDGELDGEGYGASIEVGQVLKANDHFNIIPQAQLSYSEVDFDSFTGPNGERVSLADASSTVARLGVAIESSQSTELEKGFKSFASLDLLYDFEADTRVNIGGFGLINEDESLFVDLGLGGSYAFGDKGQYGLSTKFNVSSSVQNFFDSYGLEGLVQFNAKF